MILVTGGAGLLGTSLIRILLAEGKTVKAIWNKTALTDFNSPLLIPVHADINDVYALQEIMQDVTEIYHCAALVSFWPKDAERLYKINVEGTANIVNAALEAGVRKLVYVSSVSALGRIRTGITVNETMEWTEETSNSKYGHSKYLGELEVWRGVAEGLNAVVVNPVFILGPGDWKESSTKLFLSIYEGLPWYPEGTSGFVDVRDVSAAMIALMNSEISAEKFIISSGNFSYREIFNRIADAFNKKRPTKEITPFLAAIKWRLEAIKSKFTGSSPLLTKETATTSLAKVQYDNSKLLKALPGFQYHTIQQTINDTCATLQQKLNN